MSFSIPRAVVADAVGSKITVETARGEQYSGILEAVDHHFNVRLSFALVRSACGQYSAANTLTVQASQVKYIALPPEMKNAPFFKQLTSGAIGATTHHERHRQAGKKQPKALKVPERPL